MYNIWLFVVQSLKLSASELSEEKRLDEQSLVVGSSLLQLFQNFDCLFLS